MNYLKHLVFILFLINGFHYEAYSNTQYVQISEYIQVWGLVKYYQPKLAVDCPDFDSIFIADIQDIVTKPVNRRTFNRKITQLLKIHQEAILQQDTLISNQTDSLEAVFQADEIWIEKSPHLNKENKKKLFDIYNESINGPLCHISQVKGNQQIKISKEKYVLKAFPSVEIRLLSLAKFWNLTNYFFAYKNLIPTNWNDILPIYVEKTINSKDAEDFHLAMLKLSVLLEDSHVFTESYILDRFWGGYKLPVKIRLIDGKAFITSILGKDTTKSTFQIGDQILSINGLSYSEGFRKNKDLVSGSNLSRKKFKYSRLYVRVREKQDTFVNILRETDTMRIVCQPVSIGVSTIKESVNSTNPVEIFNDSVGYLDLSRIKEVDFFESFSKIENTPHLIIDLRKYPNLLLDSLSKVLYKKPVVMASWYSPALSNPGTFINRGQLSIGIINKDAYQGKIYIMVNEGSQSRAEFTAMALQKTENNITIGSQTSGADGDVIQIQLPGSIYTSFSGLGITYPNGDQTQKTGIRIDIEYKPSGWLIKDYIDAELLFVLKEIIGVSIPSSF